MWQRLGRGQEGGAILILTTDACCHAAGGGGGGGASLMAQMGENLPGGVVGAAQSLGQEHPLETRMAIHSNILAWRIPWTQEPVGLQSMGLQSFGHD